MNLFGIPVRGRQIAHFASDVLAAMTAVYIGNAIRFGDHPNPIDLFQTRTGASTFFIVLNAIALYVAEAYAVERKEMAIGRYLRVLSAIGIALFIQSAISYATPHWKFFRGAFVYSYVSFAVLACAWRAVADRIAPVGGVTRTLVLGLNPAGQRIAEVITSDRELSRENPIVGFLEDYGSPEAGERVLGKLANVTELSVANGVRQIIVATSYLEPAVTQQLLKLKKRGIHISDMPTVYKRLIGRVPVRHLDDAWILFGPDFSEANPATRLIVRGFDVFVATIGLVLAAPVVAVLWVLIRVQSRGPGFYSQVRLGKYRVPFKLYKLRTMVEDAEETSGPVWSNGADDHRVTRMGRFLRRSRLDELPQLWNVLRGEMSIVGPRPEREAFVERLEREIPYYGLRFATKPGLTGWAQVSYRYGSTVEEAATKLEYELYSIQERNLALYLLILLKTVQAVLMRPGS